MLSNISIIINCILIIILFKGFSFLLDKITFLLTEVNKNKEHLNFILKYMKEKEQA